MKVKEKPHDYYIRVRLSKEEFDRLDEMSKAQRRSKSEVVRIGLDNLYNKKES